MEYFKKDNPDYIRIKGFFEFIAWTICGIKKPLSDISVGYDEAVFDLMGFERRGEKYEF